MEFVDLIETFKTDAGDAVKKLEEIARRVDAEKLFVSTVLAMGTGPADEMSEASHGAVPAQIETLAFHLFPFFGIADGEVTPVEVDFCQSASQKILTLNSFANDVAPEDEDPADARMRQIASQAKVVRGSAFQEQTAGEILGVQSRFDGWFEGRCGISPTRAQEVLWKLYERGNAVLQSFIQDVFAAADGYEREWRRVQKVRPDRRTPGEHQFASMFPNKENARRYGGLFEMSNRGFNAHPVRLQDLGLSDDEVVGLKQLIGLTSANRADLASAVEVRQRPLYILDDGRVVMLDIANAMDALWDAFEKVARLDQAFHDGRYQVHKGKWLEEKTAEYLARLFPAGSIYEGLSYPDLTKGAGATAELDIVVSWGPFLILAEAKAKQFRLEGQLGDVGRLRTDVKKNVQDAFEQAKRASDYIEATPHPEFTEIKTGRKLSIGKAALKKTFLMTVSLHQLAGLATTLAVFQDLNLFTQGDYPFSISIADLDFVTEFTKHPDVFLHYIEKRLEVQELQVSLLVDELDFLGAYLDTRFARPYFWEKQGDTAPNAIWISGFSAIFDNLMMFRRGLIEKGPEIGLDIPPEIDEILRQLRSAADDLSRELAFKILNLPDDVLQAIMQLLQEARAAKLTWGNIRRQAHLVGDVLVVGTAATGVPTDYFAECSKEISKIEKYRHKATRTFALAVSPVNKASVFDWINYVDEPWTYDPHLERLIGAEPPISAVGPFRLPKPNDPCFCGEGRKFKKCHGGRC
ncbi:MAG: SEC-C domain-containing protein [Pyrinomonadaceae bacterium]|nr:SEC-C domain-containing protein [Pyrinomonadaceae bacterium]MBP6211781.1 SEC-C domain-containing protein [Pyrinomonadaceae bacterium]